MLLKIIGTQIIKHKVLLAVSFSMAIISWAWAGQALMASSPTAPETPLAQMSLDVNDTPSEKAAKAQASAQQATTAAKVTTTKSLSNHKAIVLSKPSGSLRGATLYVDPALSNQGRPSAIASQPVARWIGGWTNNVQSEVNNIVSAAASQNALAQLVVYNIPARDCGSYSAGGANNSEAYRAWVRQISAGIGQRKAIVILEPDALAQLDCLSGPDQHNRLADLSDAVSVLTSQTQAYVYLDAGHSSWHSTVTMADRLHRANVGQAQGFALNVSNFQTTTSNITYGNSLAAKTNGKHYVIDTSRNGQGPAPGNEWCNPGGRGLGAKPTTSPEGGTYHDTNLWVKTPGESDGTCNGGPPAGQWFEAYAQLLIANAAY